MAADILTIITCSLLICICITNAARLPIAGLEQRTNSKDLDQKNCYECYDLENKIDGQEDETITIEEYSTQAPAVVDVENATPKQNVKVDTAVGDSIDITGGDSTFLKSFIDSLTDEIPNTKDSKDDSLHLIFPSDVVITAPTHHGKVFIVAGDSTFLKSFIDGLTNKHFNAEDDKDDTLETELPSDKKSFEDEYFEDIYGDSNELQKSTFPFFSDIFNNLFSNVDIRVSNHGYDGSIQSAFDAHIPELEDSESNEENSNENVAITEKSIDNKYFDIYSTQNKWNNGNDEIFKPRIENNYNHLFNAFDHNENSNEVDSTTKLSFGDYLYKDIHENNPVNVDAIEKDLNDFLNQFFSTDLMLGNRYLEEDNIQPSDYDFLN